MANISQTGTATPQMRPSRFRLPPGEAWRENLYGYLFISPWILGFVLFLAGPLLVSLGLMFTEYAGFKKITYVGLANFEELIKFDIRFIGSLRVSAVFAFWTVSLAIIISLAMALLLNQRFKGTHLFPGPLLPAGRGQWCRHDLRLGRYVREGLWDVQPDSAYLRLR